MKTLANAVICDDAVNAILEKLLENKKLSDHYSALEQNDRKDLKQYCSDYREGLLNEKKVIGTVNVNDSSVRVEFRFKNGALSIDQEELLKKHFGNDFEGLFERGQVVTNIPKPSEMLADMEKAGINPWEYLELRVKKDMDSPFIGRVDKQYYSYAEAFLPRKTFMACLATIIKNLGQEAVEFVREYLSKALDPSVVIRKKSE